MTTVRRVPFDPYAYSLPTELTTQQQDSPPAVPAAETEPEEESAPPPTPEPKEVTDE